MCRKTKSKKIYLSNQNSFTEYDGAKACIDINELLPSNFRLLILSLQSKLCEE